MTGTFAEVKVTLIEIISSAVMMIRVRSGPELAPGVESECDCLILFIERPVGHRSPAGLIGVNQVISVEEVKISHRMVWSLTTSSSGKGYSLLPQVIF